MTTALPTVADRLYDLEPAAFVAARNALAKELRAAGDKAGAAAVAQLRRPTPLAGALNRVARHEPAVLEAALAAGAALLRATDAAVAGDAGELRPATAADRAATRALAEAVGSILGTGAADLAQRVTATVRAAVATPAVADDVRAGRLSGDVGTTGFGLGELPVDVDPTEAVPTDDLAPRRKAKQAKADQAAREEAQRVAEERRARQRVEAEHRKRIEQLASRARRLSDKADEAERVALEARAAADGAAEELGRLVEQGP